MSVLKLTDRLRGIYTIPVNDGAGLLNGKDTFTRNFETTPIQHEAADVIDELTSALEEALKSHAISIEAQTKAKAILTKINGQ